MENERHVMNGWIGEMVCPACPGQKLDRSQGPNTDTQNRPHSFLVCPSCGCHYPLIDEIPRFVSDGYVQNFGLEWNLFSKTQVDLFNGTQVSRERFLKSTQWNLMQLRGKKVLDAGCGSGRFAQIALDLGAEVYACDRSAAVDACAKNLACYPNLRVIQADLLMLPFPPQYFDFIYCLGVLQHTPKPERTFQKLSAHLRPGGRMCVDVYPLHWRTYLNWKYWWRPFLKGRSPEQILSLSKKIVPPLMEMSEGIRRIPVLGRKLSRLVPVANFRGELPLTDEQVREWALLETFDALSPCYDHPQKMGTLRRWFQEAHFKNIEVEQQLLYVGRGQSCAG